MTSISEDFVRFLYANYPDDYRKATADGVEDDVLTSIVSRHQKHYSIWQSVPEWIKAKYADKLPSDVMNGNQSVREFVVKEEFNKKEDEKETADMLNYTVSLLALGYATETVAGLVGNRQTREAIMAQANANGGVFTEEQNAQWRASREQDRELIKSDWMENSPEKYITHLVKSISRGDKRVARDSSLAESWADERALLVEELGGFMGDLSSKEDKQKLIDYLREPAQQSALSHLTDDTLAMFSGMLREKGIKLERADDGKEILIDRTNLFDTLKENFSQLQMFHQMFASNKENADRFDRRVALERADTNADDLSAQKMVSRRKGREIA